MLRQAKNIFTVNVLRISQAPCLKKHLIKLKMNTLYKNKTTIISIIVLISIFQLLSRHVPAPVTGFVADDWRSLYWGRTMTWETIIVQTADELDRPMCMLFIPATFKLLGDDLWKYAVLNVAYNTLTIVFMILFVSCLTQDNRVALCTAIVFALLPNITESFHWAHHTAIGFCSLGYVASMYYGFLYAGSPTKKVYGICAALFYGMALFAYESGALLPLVILFVLISRKTKEWMRIMIPYIGVIIVYIGWRIGWLGATSHILNYRDYLEQSYNMADLFYNARVSLSWWIGENMLRSIGNGIAGFLEWSTPLRITLMLLNVGAVAIVVLVYNRIDRSPVKVHEKSQTMMALFVGLIWFSITSIPSVVAWSAGRLNYLPGLGFALAVSTCLVRWGGMRSALMIGVLFLCVNQGTTKNWHDSGKYQKAMYDHMSKTMNEWVDAEVILVDTINLRQRQTRGLYYPIGSQDFTWALHGNAQLARSFVPAAIVDLLRLEHDLAKAPIVLNDVEYSAKTDGTELVWHGRFYMGITNRAPLDRVFIIDALAVNKLSND